MKVGFITSEFVGSGANIYTYRLIDALKIKGINTILIKYSINKYGIVIRNPHIDLRGLRTCDVLHLPVYHAFIFKKIRTKKVTTFHHFVDETYLKYTNLIEKIYYSLFLKGYVKRSLSVVDRIVAVSNYTKQSVTKTFGNLDIEVIYNSIDTEKFRPSKIWRTRTRGNKMRIFFAGNLIKRKGADLLPKIMEKLGEDYVLFYTSGLRTKRIFRQKNMFPLGRLSEKKLIEEYNKCDILLFPTRLEGFAYVVAEAMACGKPVVTTNCSSLPELVENGKNGFLCEMDDIAGFVEKVKTLWENRELREKMGKANRKKVLENFSVNRMASEYVKIYEELLSKG